MSRTKRSDILPEGALKVLSYLAIKKHGNKYQISKTWKTLSYSWVHELIKRLLEMNYIHEEEEKREKAPTGLDKCSYTLTLAGLIKILQYEVMYKNNTVDLTAKNYADMLPLIFGKWQFFKKENKRDVAIERLVLATVCSYEEYIPLDVIAAWSTAWSTKEHLEHVEKWKGLIPQIPSISDIEHYFTKVFLARELVYSPFHLADPNNPSSSELKEWLNMLYKDPDLKAFLDKLFRQKESLMKYELRNLLLLKDWWKKKSKHVQVGA